MAKYIISVFKDDFSNDFNSWWDNYLTHADNVDMHFDNLLMEYKARDIKTSDCYIEFDSEEDFLMFKLKFG